MPGEWTIAYPGTRMTLGESTGVHLQLAPEVGVLNLQVDDSEIPRGDGLAFGRDSHAGRNIGLTFSVVGRDEFDMRDKLEALTTAWRADAVRTKAGAVAELISDRGRRAYGRPRRFAPTRVEPFAAYAEAAADFTASDSLWYGPEQSLDVDIQPPLGGGLVAPLRAPLMASSTASRSRVMAIGGSVATPWLWAEIHGPIVNPELEVMGVLRQQFRLTLEAGQSIVLDSRPWSRSILRNGGNVSGLRSRASTPLAATAIPPGRHQVVLRGASFTGTARASLRWADAFTTP